MLSYNTDIYYANLSELSITNQSVGANQYLWAFGNGDTSSLFQPQYDYTSPAVYNILLIATNQYGCRDTAVLPLDVRVPQDIYVPNAFTPDGDNNNDYFSIKSQNVTDVNVTIFNRWGEEIFTSSDPAFKWDGTSHGKPVQQDVYVYVIKAIGFHGKHFDLAGAVTVLR
jgi:gliding motility-associated-like protein